MLDRVAIFSPEGATLQNAGNTVWRNVEQHAPVIDGWDLSGQETGIIEETYPADLGVPKNDFFQLRLDDLRDDGFWERRGKTSGERLAAELNSDISDLVSNTGSLFVRSNVTSGFDFVSLMQALMNERGIKKGDRTLCLNDRTIRKFGVDLAARQTLQGRPESEAWAKGQIGGNIAGFDIFEANFLSNLAGGAATTTVTATVSEAPEGGTVNSTTRTTTNVDYRVAAIAVTASSGFAVGDRVTFTNGAAAVQSLQLQKKIPTGQAMTFTIIEITNATAVKVWPKPIAVDDPALSTLEKAYANINTRILSTADMDRLNTDASVRTNTFWERESIEVFGGDAPLEILGQFDGMKVLSESMSNGQKMYMAYDANLATLNARCRLFTWYGVTNKNPSANGVGLSV
jgi:hypothetical protein